jgi:predicted XRE-type DNA-binding protein
MANPHEGSNFDDFLSEEGILEECEAVAIKRIIAEQLQRLTQERHLSKSELARQMHTSRTAVNRLLDPNNTSVTLETLVNAVKTIGGIKLNISFELSQDVK